MLYSDRHYTLAERIIEAATGDPYGDGDIVTHIGVGYAEPGYPSDAKWVLGNWNDKTKNVPGIVNGRPTKYALITTNNLPTRLGNALEWIGDIELEWSDEWAQCDECYRIVRTTADSYSWTPSYLWTNECETVCHECAHQDIGAYLADYVNDSDRAVTWCEASDLGSLGFVKWAPGDEHDYENGWYPGQDDEPKAILESIHATNSELDVVFLIDSVGQFDTRFSAYVRPGDMPRMPQHCEV